MKVITLLFLLLITLSTLLFGISNTANAENTKQAVLQPRVEYVQINGVLWVIVYDADDNVIQASAVGHSEKSDLIQ
jgi:hypothetical protein